jgi:putative molybdopterin biosynthesis protein
VALGAADVGFTIRGAALALELTFVPLVEERFDLVLTEDMLEDARAQRLLDMLSTGTFRRELAELGYDTALCATKITDVTA